MVPTCEQRIRGTRVIVVQGRFRIECSHERAMDGNLAG